MNSGKTALRKTTLVFAARIVAMLVLTGAIISVTCLARDGSNGQVPGPSKHKTPRITIKAKIGEAKNMGGYFVQDQETKGELFIVNQSPDVLGKLHGTGKVVTIEGYLPTDAEHLFIAKIDGKKYSAPLKTLEKGAAPR
jgi:hypothetical protein